MIETYDNRLVIKKEFLQSIDSIEIKFIMPRKNIIFIEGTVLSPENNPIENACIEVIEVNTLTNEEKIVGGAFTDIYGKYGFTLDIRYKRGYKFTVYMPIEEG